MDATRARRTRDRARQGWYARHRQWRFARYLGFGDGIEPPAARPDPNPSARLGRIELGICPATRLDASESAAAPRMRAARELALTAP